MKGSKRKIKGRKVPQNSIRLGGGSDSGKGGSEDGEMMA